MTIPPILRPIIRHILAGVKIQINADSRQICLTKDGETVCYAFEDIEKFINGDDIGKQLDQG